MAFSEWLLTQYDKWKETAGADKKLADFANYLDVPPTSLSNWINAGYKPRSDTINRLSKKLGLEVYEVLGLRRPDGEDPRAVLLASGFPPVLVDELLAARAEYSTELASKGITTDTPEAREIIATALARHGIKFNFKE